MASQCGFTHVHTPWLILSALEPGCILLPLFCPLRPTAFHFIDTRLWPWVPDHTVIRAHTAVSTLPLAASPSPSCVPTLPGTIFYVSCAP